MVASETTRSSQTFGFHQTDRAFVAHGTKDSDPIWQPGQLVSAESVSLSPAAAVLSYGYGVMEGLKAQRTDDGRVLIFRPRDHAERLQRSARRLSLPPYPTDLFVEAAESLVRANASHLPPSAEGALYLRPTLYATESMLGLRVAKRFCLSIYCCPIGPYFSRGAIRLRVLAVARAAPGGTGAVKSIGNYAGMLTHRLEAGADGFDDVIFTDAATHTLLEETSGSNVFALMRDGSLVTPPLGDTILAGITRDSVIRMAKDELGLPVEERPLPVREVLDDAEQLFCTGTAWTVQPVEELETKQGWVKMSSIELARTLRERLLEIQAGRGADNYGWTHAVEL